MTADTSSARQKAGEIIKRARMHIMLHQPFFATAMLRRPFVECSDTPTMSVTADGLIRYNPQFVSTLTAQQLVFAICHEIMHYLSGHIPRTNAFIEAHSLQSIEPTVRLTANIVGDWWINEMLRESNVGAAIPGVLFNPEALGKTFEQMLDEQLKKKKEQQQQQQQQQGNDGNDGNGDGDGDGDGNGNDGDGDGDGGDGNPLGGDMDPNTSEGEALSPAQMAQAEAQRKVEIAAAAAAAKAAGKLSGSLAAFVAATLDVTTPWYDVLEAYMTSLTDRQVSWSKPNRRYAPSLYLPSTAPAPSMGEVVLQIDVSGSITKEELGYYNGHMRRVLEQCHPSTVHVLYTDTRVLKHEVYDNPDELSLSFYSGGGTNMEAGFEYLREQGIEPDVVVTLTDGYDTYTSAPDFPVVWCCSTEQKIPYGKVVRFKVE